MNNLIIFISRYYLQLTVNAFMAGTVATTLFTPVYQYSCDECDFETDSPGYFSTHQRVWHRDEGRIYSCDICSQSFTFAWGVDQHKRDLHNGDGILYSCKYCDLVSNSNRNIKRHEERQHLMPDGDKTTQCNICQRDVKQKSLRRHMGKHQRENPKFYHNEEKASLNVKCDKCDYKTYAQRHLKMHNMTKHPTIELNCQYCSFVTAFEVKLKLHLIKMHKLLKCEMCDFQTNVKDKMRQHEYKHPLKCKSCDFSTFSTTFFRVHMCEEHGEPIKCNYEKTHQCKILSQSRLEFIEHMKSHGRSVHNCQKCPFLTANKNELSRHGINDHKLQYANSLQCKQCEFSTGSDIYFRVHMCEAHGEPLKCSGQYCDTLSTSRSEWIEHTKSHHSYLNIYSCEQCDFITSNKNELSPHRVSVHKTHHCLIKSCGLSFSTKKAVQTHYSKDHPEKIAKEFIQKRIRCQVRKVGSQPCKFVGKDQDDLENHRKEHKKKALKCHSCEFSTSNKFKLRNHRIRTHNSPRKISLKCRQCEFVGTRRGDLKVHKREHKKNDIGRKKIIQNLLQCESCEFSTFKKFKMRSHRLKEHNSPMKIKTKLKCNQCDFFAKSRYYLLVHKTESHSRPVSSLIQNFENTKKEGGEAASSIEQIETQNEYVECDDVKPEIKIEPDNVPEPVSTITVDAGEAEEGATYVCPLNSCTFMTKIFSEKMMADHFTSSHPDSNTVGVKFITLF